MLSHSSIGGTVDILALAMHPWGAFAFQHMFSPNHSFFVHFLDIASLLLDSTRTHIFLSQRVTSFKGMGTLVPSGCGIFTGSDNSLERGFMQGSPFIIFWDNIYQQDLAGLCDPSVICTRHLQSSVSS